MWTRLIILGLWGVGISALALGLFGGPALSPEHAKAALVDLLRDQPNAFFRKWDPEEYAAKPIEDLGGGEYRLGWFLIDVPHSSFQLHLRGQGHAIHATGEFRHENGHWVARSASSSIGCWK